MMAPAIFIRVLAKQIDAAKHPAHSFAKLAYLDEFQPNTKNDTRENQNIQQQVIPDKIFDLRNERCQLIHMIASFLSRNDDV